MDDIMKKQLALVLCAACPALMGAGLGLYRNSVVSQCTDPASGLLQTGSAPHFTAFFIAACVCALICFALAFSARRLPLCCGIKPVGTGVKIARVLTAFLFFGAGAVLFLSAPAPTPLLILKAVFLCACGAASIAVVRAGSVSSKGLCSLFPLFFMSIYLLSFYRDCARNPLIFTFAFEILTVVCVLLSLYLTCCPWFGKRRYGLLLLFVMLSTMGGFTLAAGYLLNHAFFSAYLPLTAADAPLCAALLLWLWTDIAEFSLPAAQNEQLS